MVEQNKWNYCAKTTREHHVAIQHPNCIEEIDSLSKRDGAKKTPFQDEICINLDNVEICLAKKDKRNNRKTMDFSFGIKVINQSKFVLVELRLNYKNINNLSKTELDSKIYNSKIILGQNPNLLNHYYFVFKSNLKNQAHRNLRRIYLNKNIVSGIDLLDLKNIYF